MALFGVAVAIAGYVLWRPALAAFMANPALNGVIVGVLLVGIVVCVRQALTLFSEISWIEAYQRQSAGAAPAHAPRLMAPIARALGDDGQKATLTTMSTRALLDGVDSRLDEGRELARYLVGLLIFLGLLGTFWGLLETVRSIGDVVDGLAVDSTNASAGAVMFDQLRAGLRAPLDGMGTAFSSSLFGLSGALALGFLDLQAGQAQNRFYNDVEDWLSGMARFRASPLAGDGEGDGARPSAFTEALLQQTAEALDDLRRLVARSEDGRRDTSQGLARMTDRLQDLGERLESLGAIVERQQRVIDSATASQADIGQGLAALTAQLGAPSPGDPEARRQLAQIERLLARMGDGMEAGRTELAHELRSEFRLLARALAGGSLTPGGESRGDVQPSVRLDARPGSDETQG